MNAMNTPRKGTYRWIVFKQGKEWIATALEFNIVQVGDDPDLVYSEMQEAVKGYVEAAQKTKGFRETVFIPMLNQEADPEYEYLWNQARSSSLKKERSMLPSNVFDFGVRNLAFA